MTQKLSHQERYQRARLAFQQGDTLSAEQRLRSLVDDFPEIHEYRIAFANFLSAQNQANEAVTLFRRSTPDDAYNRGHYLSHSGQAHAAIEQFKMAIQLGLASRADALSRIAGLLREELHDDDTAEKYYLEAIGVDPSYNAAKINLANLYQDRGDKNSADKLLEQLDDNDPLYPLALTRRAAMHRRQDMLQALELCMKNCKPNRDIQCDMLYELGHQNESQGHYDRAWQAFQAANQINAAFNPRFQAEQWQRLFDDSIGGLRKAPAFSSQATAPRMLFICGMFRSGSTLLEQILAAHPKCSAGGELNLFPKMAAQIDEVALQETYQHYLSRIQVLGDSTHWVTDKRPDNLSYVDLIKQVFPDALIVITERDLGDNALSIYQQRLGPAMNYACQPEHIKQYAQWCQQLSQHWQDQWPNDVFTVRYEALIDQPQQTLEILFKRLDIDWREECLAFHTLNNTVKTASVWQVRQPLNNRSIGRSKHYPDFLKQLG